MSGNSNIEWTETTWNPIAGCTPVSPGCLNCYAATMSNRLGAMGQSKYAGLTVKRDGRHVFNGKISFDEKALLAPLSWKKPRVVFANSMSDLFHESVPFEFVDKVFAVMALTPQHTYQVLTKRPERMAEYLKGDSHARTQDAAAEAGWISKGDGFCYRAWRWPLPNVWLGTSVEDQQRADERIPHLLRCPAAVRFLSVEPMLGEIDLRNISLGAGESIDLADGPPQDFVFDSLNGTAAGGAKINWVIVGGESGHGARPMDIAWPRSIVRQCREAGVACFVKQLGAKPIIHCSQCGKDIGKVRGGWVDACGPTHAAMIAESQYIRDSKGGDLEEWPADLRVREMPQTERLVKP